jgi:hypothetical protein
MAKAYENKMTATQQRGKKQHVFQASVFMAMRVGGSTELVDREETRPEANRRTML